MSRTTTPLRALAFIFLAPAHAIADEAMALLSRYALVPSLDRGLLSVYAVAADGGLELRTTIRAGSAPRNAAAAGRYAYVVDILARTVTGYAIDARTGELIAVGPSLPTGKSPEALAVDPMRNYVYVANGDSNDISAYRIDAQSGVLTPVGRYSAGAYPTGIAIDPCGDYMYVVNYLDDTVLSYAIDRRTGALSATNMARTGSNPAAAVVHPSGKFLHVADGIGGTISSYRITRGRLTAISNIPAPVYPYDIAIHPSGQFMYTANFGSDDVAVYTLRAEGTAVRTFVAPAGVGPFSIDVDPSGRYVYVANVRGSSVDVFTFDPESGMLAPLATIHAEPGSAAIALTDAGEGTPALPLHCAPR